MKKSAVLNSDGGARGNPGPAGIGYVLAIDGEDVIEKGEYIGETTNNVAEYTALIHGLKLAITNQITHLNCYLDSELIVKQIRGEYRVKNEGLKTLFAEVQGLMKHFEEINFCHVPRAKNKRADLMVNIAIDQHTKKPR